MKDFHSRILRWYEKQKRPLPWRKNKDPYRIWISEIMLQQTRVEAVIPYFERFLSHFPTIKSLANAPEDKVTNLWAGLGYYSRARNLHKAAIEIEQKFQGKMPQTKEELLELPGIGDYTASAIASIAYEAPHIALDGNLERVLSRVLGEKKDPKKEARPSLLTFGKKLTAKGKAGDINQALMDLSASICLPKNPHCPLCPIENFCLARKNNLTEKIPFKKKKLPPIELQSYGWILFSEIKGVKKVLLTRRKKKTWLAGMWDLPWWLEEDGKILAPHTWEKTGVFKTKRTITKYKIHFSLVFYRVKKIPQEKQLKDFLHSAGEEFRWCSLEELEQYNLPRPSEKALEAALHKLN